MKHLLQFAMPELIFVSRSLEGVNMFGGESTWEGLAVTVATLLALATEAAERRAAAKNLICMMIDGGELTSGL